MPIAEAIIEHYPKPVPPLKFGGDKAFYNPNSDFIQMPHMADFESAQDFYRTLFHEFAHSTGASNRLHRDFTGRFGSKKYAFEELIAEWGATFLSAEAGIIFHSNNNHAEYIKSWNAALTHIKDDNKFIMRACSKAQELTDYVLDRDKNGNPKYLKDFKKIVKEKSSSDQFEQFRKIVLKAKNFDDAYVMVSTVKNVPKKVADAFSKKYNPNNIRSQRQAFKVFYEEVKGKPTVSSLIKEFVESCKNDLKGGVFESTKHKFKAGDQYRSDFDYKGMLTAGTKVTEKTPASTILKLYNSFSDVNYHDQGGLLWEILELKKEANKLDKTQLALFGKTKGVSNIDLRRYKNKSKGSIYADLHKIQNVLKENIPASIKADLEADLEKLHNYAKKKFPISKKKVAIRKNPSVKKSTMDKAKKAVKKIKQLGTLVIDVSTTQPTANVKNEGLALAGQLGNVPVYEPQKTEEPKQDVVAQVTKKPKGVMSSNELMSLQFDTLNFEGEWAEFMDSPAKNMRIAIWGKPKNGKTAGATKFANYLTSFGNVLYNFADQGVNKSTKDLWQMSGLAQQPNAFLTDTRELDELEKLCASGKFDFVFIDMINTYIHRTGIKYFEFEDRFLKKFPSISFILIFEVTKNGDFKGDQGWTHLVDALITVDSFVMENTGRYGVGHYIVWKHGLETTNPKKYKEYFSEEVQYPTTMTI